MGTPLVRVVVSSDAMTRAVSSLTAIALVAAAQTTKSVGNGLVRK
jgi:hypothetical protein